MSFLRAWLCAFVVGTAVLFLSWCWTLATPPFKGDLTRVARLSEAAFGPTVPEPEVQRAWLQETAPADADVLVIGDSFSARRLWQARLVAAGLRVATVHIRETVGFCSGLNEWIRQSGFRGRTVILESVERNAAERLKPGRHCERPRLKSTKPSGMPDDSQPPRGLTGEPLTTGPITAFNTAQALSVDTERTLGHLREGERIRIHRLPDGCRYFSHAACQTGLFLADDLDRPSAGEPHLAEAQALKSLMSGYTVIWLVVPDKSSVYLRPDHFASFAQALQARGLGPDLFRPLRVPGRDVYLPNDSHLSAVGYLRVGDEVLGWMKRYGVAVNPPRAAAGGNGGNGTFSLRSRKASARSSRSRIHRPVAARRDGELGACRIHPEQEAHPQADPHIEHGRAADRTARRLFRAQRRRRARRAHSLARYARRRRLCCAR